MRSMLYMQPRENHAREKREKLRNTKMQSFLGYNVEANRNMFALRYLILTCNIDIRSYFTPLASNQGFIVVLSQLFVPNGRSSMHFFN